MGRFYLQMTDSYLQHFELVELGNTGRLDYVGLEATGALVRRPANASEVFQSPVEILSPSGTFAAGDFDGDGWPDVVAQSSAFAFEVLPGVGDGTFGSSVHTLDADAPSDAVAVGDLDGDGHLDVVTATFGGGNTIIEVFFGDGDFGFSSAVQIPTTNYNNLLRVADVDGDGTPDIVSSHHGIVSTGMSVIRSNGDRTFATPQHFGCVDGCNNPRDFVILDLNDDCVLDLVMLSNDVQGPVFFHSQ